MIPINKKKICLFFTCLLFIILIQNTNSIENEGCYSLVDDYYNTNDILESEKSDVIEVVEGSVDSQGFSLVNTPPDYHCINNFTGRDLPIKVSSNAASGEGISKSFSEINVFSAWVLKADTKNHYFYTTNGGFYFSSTIIRFMSWTGSTVNSGSTPLEIAINNNEWYHLLFSRENNHVSYYVDGILYACIIDTPYNLGNTLYLTCHNGGSGTSTAYFDDIYIGNSTEDAFRSFYNSKYYINQTIDVNVDSNENIYEFYTNITIVSNITQSFSTFIYNNCTFEEFSDEFSSYFNHFVDYSNNSIFLILGTNASKPFELNISINILITYIEYNDTIVEGGITVENMINIILMNQEFILLIALIVLSLYTSNKYPNGILLNAFWLFSVSIYGIYVMSTLEEIWFALIIVLFNAILQIAYIEKNYRREK